MGPRRQVTCKVMGDTHNSYIPEAPCATRICLTKETIPTPVICCCFLNPGEGPCESCNFMNYYISFFSFCVLEASLLLPGGNVPNQEENNFVADFLKAAFWALWPDALC